MGRVIFNGDEQINFLNLVKSSSGFSNDQLALFCNISPRMFRDWARGKYTISDYAFLKLIQAFNLAIPNKVKIVDDYWYVPKGARKGALRRFRYMVQWVHQREEKRVE